MPRARLQIALGTALRLARLGKKLSQEQVAELASVHRTYYSAIERGERNPSLASLERIAAAIDLPLSGLIQQAEQITELEAK